MTRVDQVMPALVYGDAIGNHAMEIWKMLRDKGIACTIYAQYIDPRYAHAARPLSELADQPNRVLIYHFSIGSPVSDLVLGFKQTKLAVYYHNITPAEFFDDVNPQLAGELRRGRQEFARLSAAPIAIAASEYNRQEMLAAGYTNVALAHYLVDFERLERGARTAEAQRLRNRYDDGRFTLLFVGRVAPNKCQHDLIHLVNYYRTLIDPDVRLLLVGNFANAGAYHSRLQVQIHRLGLQHNVELTGPIGTDDGLGAIYQRANAFVCASEHEGFCVPVIEAMHFQVPVFAYRATGIPYTLGKSGVQFTEKRWDWVAEAIAQIASSQDARKRLVAGQTSQLGSYQVDASRAALTQLIDHWHA